MSEQKRYHIETWGCQMNVADAAAAARQLESLGYIEAAAPEDADFIMLETCCVREKPEHKVYSRLGELRPLQQAKPELIIAVCGCMAQKESHNLIRNAVLRVDIVLGPRRIFRLPELLAEVQHTGKAQVDVDIEETPREPAEQNYDLYQRQGAIKAFVNIIEGCNYHCAYCIVPTVRGRFTSRHPEAITDEVRQLVAVGIKEVTLLGQSVLAYGRDQGRHYDIVDLFMRLQGIAGLQRIRFTTNHPLEVNQRIIDAVNDIPIVMEHFHMPIQAGDDRLLKAMKRGYTVTQYEERLAMIREAIPGVSVTSDIIVGFPGETDEMFENSLETYRRIAFDQQFMFVYSPRPGTPAAILPDQIPQEVKVARMKKIVEMQNSMSLQKNEAQAGNILELMIDGPSKRDSDKYSGRTRNDKAFILPATRPLLAGEIIHARVEKGYMWGFSGQETVKP